MNARQSLILAAVAGALAAVLAYFWFSSKEREMESMSVPVPVLVAKKHIPSGTWVDEGLVEVTMVPRKFVQPGALRSPEEALGQLSLAPFAPGEQMLANKLSMRGVALSLTVPPGKRAVTVAVDPAGSVAGLVKPGDLVDVLVTVDREKEPRTFALIQAAPVLAVGKSFSLQPVPEESSPLVFSQTDTVTLAVSPFEAQRLTHLENIGRIKLTLRSPGDKDVHPLPELKGRQVRRGAGRTGAMKRR